MKNERLKSVKNYFPKAEPLKDTIDDLLSVAAEDLGYLNEEIAYAVSFCSDEVDSMQFTDNEMVGPFNMGGLGGYPFNGLTGMSAFSAHVPDGGIAAILYGPHIGITAGGTVGKIHRVKQNETTNCCGSVSAALNNLLSNNIEKGDLNRQDYQQKVIEQILLSEEERIKKADDKVLEATEVVYETIDKKINDLINKTDFPCDNIIKIGGIFINSDKNREALWAKRIFEVRD